MKIKRILAAVLAVLMLIPAAYAAEEEREPVRIAVIDTGISPEAIDADHLLEGRNYIIPERDTADRDGHGTAVASIIVGSESAGIEGVCPEAVLIPLVYYDYAEDGEKRGGDGDMIAQMIRDAVDVYDCDIINISAVMAAKSSEVEKAMRYAWEHGVFIACASGNDGTTRNRYPAACEGAFCVGALNADESGAAVFSNRQSYVDIAAPGVDVPVAATDGSRKTLTGTSFSTAYVSGTAAGLMMEYPELTAAQITQILIASACDLAAPGHDNETGWGSLDMQKAFAYAKTGQIFRDVASTDWFFREVNEAAGKQILNGTDAVTFSPYQPTTRAMLWVMLYRSEGLSPSKNPEFWYSDAQKWAVSAGISDGSDPNAGITREQMATILWRYAKYKGMDVSGADEDVLTGYQDAAAVSDWAAEAMRWACGAGLINGSAGALLPGNTADRAQTAVILMRFLNE